MSIFESIINSFNGYINATSSCTEPLTPYIAEATHLLAATLLHEKKIFCCSSGNAFAVAQQFCADLGNSHNLQRPGLPALLLGAMQQHSLSMIDQNLQHDMYARQLQALAQEGDLLFVVSSSGQEKALLAAIHTACERNMPVITLTGGPHQEISQASGHNAVNIAIRGLSNSQTLAIQFLTAHMLSDLVEQLLFGNLQ
jgi:phosphoheptose isomerase